MSDCPTDRVLPKILAPAGDTPAFLAALAAGADAVYLGLKNFSARMEAENFGLLEVSRLTGLAHDRGAEVYVAMNTMLKEQECLQAYHLLKRLQRQTRCDGIIVQDLAFVDLARQAGFEGGIFLSTLANITHPEALQFLADRGVQRVILPRELSIDEIRMMGEACPADLDLECFIHGALCYCVSGRCYWSSYMGGKSGLRGRCVQPCRRLYHTGDLGEENRKTRTDRGARYFSCQDLSLDVLAKTLLDIPHLTTWKIEGRKKGPHYVYYTVTAYRMLRDAPDDSAIRRQAAELLERALGRPGTHARFLPQKTRIPTDPTGITSSGLLAGKIRNEDRTSLIKPHFPLLPQDYLRVGIEEDRWHATVRVTKFVPKGGNYVLKLDRHRTPPNGTPVFLIDRREKELVSLLRTFQEELDNHPGVPSGPVEGSPRHPGHVSSRRRMDMRVLPAIPMGKENRPSSRSLLSLWLTPRTADISRTVARRVAWWLPPVVWPDESRKLAHLIQDLWRDGARHFVCNAPWQRCFFSDTLPQDADLVAGPFCNLANAYALDAVAHMGFSAAFVSPELPRDEILALPGVSPLPLGFVIAGSWPVGISRFGLLGLRPNTPFSSPKGEVFWTRQYGENTWIYPAWSLDFSAKEDELLSHGYTFFARIFENAPKALPESSRPGLFNWDGKLL